MDYPIRPEHIKADVPFENLFDDPIMELYTHVLISFAQERGQGWQPFLGCELIEYCGTYDPDGPILLWFGRLVHSGLVEAGEQTITSRIYNFTHHFITACFANSPAITACH